MKRRCWLRSKATESGFTWRRYMPFKLEGYLNYLQTRSWRSDLKVLCQTIFAVAFPSKAPLPTLEEIQSYGIRHRR